MSKKILILYPHFPPSNLAGVHRPRLFAQHLPQFGWEPTILTVHENYYEEAPDHHLVTLLPQGLRIEKVAAFKVGKVRLIGDIGLRAFFQLYKKAKALIKTESFDFLYIPIPSFYCALLGRWLHGSTKIKYGIDYIDPWVHHFPGSEKLFSRHWWSMKLSTFLEPIAVKKAALITGVAEGYYRGVIERNPTLTKTCLFGAMPYGGEEEDHQKIKQLDIQPYLFKKRAGKIQLIYAGAMLPKAYDPLERIFKAMQEHSTLFRNVEVHFIGTGKKPNNPSSYAIKSLAEKYGLWNSVIYEHPARIPYLDVLVHLSASSGIFILGSTEPHYTPSKAFQGVLSAKPILAVLHQESTAVNVIRESNAGMVLTFNGETGLIKLEEDFASVFLKYESFLQTYTEDNVKSEYFKQFSAKECTAKLVELLSETEDK